MTESDFDPQVFLRQLDPQDFLSFGLEQVAYIRPQKMDDEDVFGIYAADGTQLFIVDSFEAALRAIHINDLDATTLQ